MRGAAAAPGTHRLAMPALRTAVEMALTAVQRELRSCVNSPVPFARLPSSITKRVMVMTLVSKVERSVMLAALGAWNCPRRCCHHHLPLRGVARAAPGRVGAGRGAAAERQDRNSHGTGQWQGGDGDGAALGAVCRRGYFLPRFLRRLHSLPHPFTPPGLEKAAEGNEGERGGL